jgi:dTDP-glucose pyrophosphorylase
MEAVKKMNTSSMQILLVVDESETLLGVITDGDIRRALLENIDFKHPISSIMTQSPITLANPPDKAKALSLMKEHDIQHIPLVDSEGRSSGLLLWKDFFKNGDIAVDKKPNTVVIMAGGKGTRLDLFTKILPKPLIPIGEKPIIEHIIDNFCKCGFTKFLISLNYKADMIKMYFSDNGYNYEVDYIEEDDFLGTAGALSLAGNRLNDTFIVSNCDVIIDANLDHLFNYHKENKNHATILSTVRNIKIPYGVLKTNNADLEEIIEKPEYNFIINSGIYVLEPEIIDLIPKNQAVDMPDLLLKGKRNGLKVQIYPMTCSWFDVGEWGEYKKAIEHMTALGAGT